MKDSGVKWLGDIPKHWTVRRLKSVCSRSALYGANVPASSYTNNVGVRFLRTTDITDDGQLKPGGVFVPGDSVRDYILSDGDLLISRSGTIGRSFLYERKKHGPCGYAGYLVRFVSDMSVLPRYLFLFTKTQAFVEFLRVKAISSTIDNVNGEKYANCTLPFPPLPEQIAIARFLDHADRRIQRYVKAKQKLIALLEEQKQTIIHQAVTGQIDVRTGKPYPAYKPSGVEWLGDVPDRWDVRRLKQVCSRSALYGANIPAASYTQAGVRFLRTTDVMDDGALKVGGVFLPCYMVRDYRLADGDLLISRSGTIGRSFLYNGKKHGPCSYAGYLVRFVLASDVLPKYVFLFTKTRSFVEFLRVKAITSTIENVNGEKYANCPLPLPSIAEQAAIVRYLDSAIEKITAAIYRTRHQMMLLSDYRSRLIADVVTGRFNVGMAAADSPDVRRM